MTDFAASGLSDKGALRQQALAARTAVPETARRHFAEVLAREGLLLAARHKAGIVSAFWPIRGEPDCRPLLEAAAEAGLGTALPIVVPGRHALDFRAWRPGELLETGRFGLSEPAAAAPLVVPDLVLVPCAAFDRAGHRIGYGRGHYDATLTALRAHRPVVAVAVAFSVQEVAAVPHEAHDVAVDLVLTEREIIHVTRV